MNIVYHYQVVLTLLSEHYQKKCAEVRRLSNNQRYSPKVTELRQQEADELKGILDKLTRLNSHDLMRLRSYGMLDEYLRNRTNENPDLLGHHIILGPDKPELFGYYSRIRWNVPISFFKK